MNVGLVLRKVVDSYHCLIAAQVGAMSREAAAIERTSNSVLSSPQFAYAIASVRIMFDVLELNVAIRASISLTHVSLDSKSGR